MKNRAIDAQGAQAATCRCARPLAHRVLDESAPDCLKCGREIEGAHAPQGLLDRAGAVATDALVRAGVAATRLPGPGLQLHDAVPAGLPDA